MTQTGSHARHGAKKKSSGTIFNVA